MNQVFDKEWFKNNQRWLLWLLNTPIIKLWFRNLMAIKSSDCSIKDKIIEICPNNYKVFKGLRWTKGIGIENIIKAEFRTYNKYSEKIYNAFYPVWFILHIWDLFADIYIPKLSFGFSTLTQTPMTITNTNPYHANHYQATDNETWANIRGGAGNGKTTYTNGGDASGNSCGFLFGTTLNTFYILYRTISNFDTSSLGSGVTVSAATLSYRGSATQNDGSLAFSANVYGATPASTSSPANGDYAQTGTSAFSDTAIAIASWSTSGYNDFVLNATGIAGVSKTGISSFSLKNVNFDIANSAPTGWLPANAGTMVSCYGSSASSHDKDAKLALTYATTTTSRTHLTLLGVA